MLVVKCLANVVDDCQRSSGSKGACGFSLRGGSGWSNYPTMGDHPSLEETDIRDYAHLNQTHGGILCCAENWSERLPHGISVVKAFEGSCFFFACLA